MSIKTFKKEKKSHTLKYHPHPESQPSSGPEVHGVTRLTPGDSECQAASYLRLVKLGWFLRASAKALAPSSPMVLPHILRAEARQ